MLKYILLLSLIPLARGGTLEEGTIYVSLESSSTQPQIGETIGVDLVLNSSTSIEYGYIRLYLHYDPSHLVLTGWEPLEWDNWGEACGITGEGKDIEYICEDASGTEYTCDAALCRDESILCRKVYSDFVSRMNQANGWPTCSQGDPDGPGPFCPCFRCPPPARPINQEIDDGEASWTGCNKYWIGIPTSPGRPVRFLFEITNDNRGSYIRLSEPWIPFPGGNYRGAGPPTWEHNVTEVYPEIRPTSGARIDAVFSDLFVSHCHQNPCCGNDVCELNETCSNCEVDCGLCEHCGDGICNNGETVCACSSDCGSPPSSEIICGDDLDNDCDGQTDCDDSDCRDALDCCNQNGICDGEEDCIKCSVDCVTFDGPVCGNNYCEIANGENCATCPRDCNSKLSGKKSERYCCGQRRGDVRCDDLRCSTDRNLCVSIFVGHSCCGDTFCDGNETICNCAIDCGQPDPQESNCRDRADNDCDGEIDCNDSDCSSNSICQGCNHNDVCEEGETCRDCVDCSGVTKGKLSQRYCCGNGQLEPPEGDGSICDGNP